MTLQLLCQDEWRAIATTFHCVGGVRGVTRACPSISQCVSGVPWAVPCGAGGGGLGW